MNRKCGVQRKCQRCGGAFTAINPKQWMCGLECRLMAKVKLGGGCWEFVGATNAGGYGSMRDVDGRSARAHRISYRLFVGPISDGLDVLHNCDNPSCVRPDHLRLGTDADNTADKLVRGRQRFGSRMPTAKLDEFKVRLLRRLYGRGVSYRRMAEKFGVSKGCIQHAVRGDSWKRA